MKKIFEVERRKDKRVADKRAFLKTKRQDILLSFSRTTSPAVREQAEKTSALRGLRPFLVETSVPDPDSNRQAGSGSVFGIRILEVKLSFKKPLQKFHDFHFILKLLPNKSSQFHKIFIKVFGPTKNKIPELKTISQKFCHCL